MTEEKTVNEKLAEIRDEQDFTNGLLIELLERSDLFAALLRAAAKMLTDFADAAESDDDRPEPATVTTPTWRNLEYSKRGN